MHGHKPSKILMLVGVGRSLIFSIFAIVDGCFDCFERFPLISIVCSYCFYGFSIPVFNAEIDII